MMKYKSETENILIKAEKKFSSCWDTLHHLKELKVDSKVAESIINFQYELASILFQIEKLRNQIIDEEKRIVKEKPRYNSDWFVNRLKTLSKYKKALVKVTVIGKSIGDAFAWWFYRFDLELLNEHANHERTLHLPTGIGGTGELEFINNVRHFQEKIVIYHGITNILRIGDVSFFDFKTLHIVSLGELKTKKSGKNKININLIALGHKSRNGFKFENSKPKKEPTEYFDKKRLDRQINSMVTALKVYDPSEKSNQNNFQKTINEKLYCQVVEDLYKNSSSSKISCITASKGLAFSGYKSRSKNPIYKYLKRKNYKPTSKDESRIKEYVLKTIKKDSLQNSLIIGKLQYTKNDFNIQTRGSIPLFWMPIKNNILKEIYFDEFEVISLFNPIHLIEELVEKGFTVNSKYHKAQNETDEKKYPRIILEYFDLFLPYVVNHLQTEDSIIKIAEHMKQDLIENKITKNTKIEIRVQQMTTEHMIKPRR